MSGERHATGATELDAVLELAEDAIVRGDPTQGLALCAQVLRIQPDHLGAHFLMGEAHRSNHNAASAEEAYRRVLRADGKHAAAWSGLAAVLIDASELDEALYAATRSIRLQPSQPDGWYCRSLIREVRGDMAGSDRDQRRASLRDPIAFPWPVPLSDAMVEAIVRSAVLGMHPSIQAYLQQVSIVLEELPDPSTLHTFEPPPPAHELLGFFSGFNLMDRNTTDAMTGMPAAIILYRRNLERYASDRDMLIEELRITVLHEVGHYLGLDEGDLRDRGLD